MTEPITIREVAKRLQCSVSTIRRYIIAGRIKVLFHIGESPRFDFEDVVASMAKTNRKGQPRHAKKGMVPTI